MKKIFAGISLLGLAIIAIGQYNPNQPYVISYPSGGSSSSSTTSVAGYTNSPDGNVFNMNSRLAPSEEMGKFSGISIISDERVIARGSTGGTNAISARDPAILVIESGPRKGIWIWYTSWDAVGGLYCKLSMGYSLDDGATWIHPGVVCSNSLTPGKWSYYGLQSPSVIYDEANDVLYLYAHDSAPSNPGSWGGVGVYRTEVGSDWTKAASYIIQNDGDPVISPKTTTWDDSCRGNVYAPSKPFTNIYGQFVIAYSDEATNYPGYDQPIDWTISFAVTDGLDGGTWVKVNSNAPGLVAGFQQYREEPEILQLRNGGALLLYDGLFYNTTQTYHKGIGYFYNTDLSGTNGWTDSDSYLVNGTNSWHVNGMGSSSVWQTTNGTLYIAYSGKGVGDPNTGDTQWSCSIGLIKATLVYGYPFSYLSNSVVEYSVIRKNTGSSNIFDFHVNNETLSFNSTNRPIDAYPEYGIYAAKPGFISPNWIQIGTINDSIDLYPAYSSGLNFISAQVYDAGNLVSSTRYITNLTMTLASNVFTGIIYGDGGGLTNIGANAPIRSAVFSPRWDDVIMPISGLRNPAAKPDFAAFIDGTLNFAFDPAADESVYGVLQVPHGISTNDADGLRIHIHYSGLTAPSATSNIVWGFEYQRAYAIGQFGSGSLTNYATNGLTLIRGSSIAIFPKIDNVRESEIYTFRLFRDADNPADVYTGDAFGLSLDAHYRRIAPGSVNEYGDY